MVKVQKENVIKDVPKELAKHYVSAGWKIVDGKQNEKKDVEKKFEINNK